ncbi:hypothetical protein SAMN00777080_1342 [Aquiflexum balticum DSM 16537]|uniref:Uncharacterized protein n=1 Tax=Aquiflexum balticum DSM 16537 TaxID=758820 RepID=A0A1W2H1E0_9BACT|nr:hypothetical protein [Aquiflexum balticum]SMD42777.1 hypothetical protein SAMN00777080_1342 [Aquiflexum balticum DSM 16537]
MENQPIDQDQTIEESNAKESKVSKKRNWSSYFKEFFMLFLAISLGFFVENQREAYVENKSAKVLAQSMLEDLEQDRKALQDGIRFMEEKDQKMDEFLRMLHAPGADWDTVAFYKSMTMVFSTFPFSPTDGTYSQMKSSGTLRYFDQRLVNKMNAYDNQLKKTVFRDELVEKGEWELVPLAATLINFEVTGELRFNKPITKETYIKIRNQDTLDLFINKVAVVRTMTGRSLQEYKAQLLLGEDLIKEIKDKYQLN